MVNSLYKLLFLGIVALNPLLGKAQEEEVKIDTIPAYVKTYEKASALIDSGRYNSAIPLLKSVLKENADYYMAHNKLAFIYYKQGKKKDMHKNLAKAEAISPMNYDTHKLRAIWYFDNQKYKESKIELDTAISIATVDKIDDPEIFYYHARLMFAGKAYKNALNSCHAALEIKPKYPEVLKLKAEIRFAMKDYLNTIRDLDEAIALMPADKPDYDCYKLRAKSRFEIKDYKGAIKDWTVILDNDAKNEEAYISRAAAKINVADNSSAIADLDEAIKLNSKNPVSWCNRGVAKGANKNNVEAMKDLDQAIKLKFDYAEAYFRRAIIKFASKDKQGACDDLAKADSLGDHSAFKLFDQYCKIRN